MTESEAPVPQKHLIQISSLTVEKDGRTICAVPDMTVSRGERLGIVGPNGSGKSTLLRVLAGFEKDFTGDCCFATSPRDIVFVHQSPFLFRGTVLSNVEFGLSSRSMPQSHRRDLAMEWLDRLGIADLAHRRTGHLSGGEARRTALARACVLSPQLMLLDEPLSELDTAGIHCVQQSLNALPQTAILIASPKSLPKDFVEKSITLQTG